VRVGDPGTIFQPDVFGGLGFHIEQEGWRFGLVEDFEFMDHHLDVARLQSGFSIPVRFLELCHDGQDKLAPESVSFPVGFEVGFGVKTT